jgi:uncharacterized RmlC-like cupin family protein
MDSGQPVIRVTPGERVEGERTAGMTREQAIAIPGMWAGLVRTEAHVTTGWHHHADYDTSFYVVSGSLRMESGPGGSQLVEAGPGDFLHVPKGAIHRRAIRAARRVNSSWYEQATGRPWSTSTDRRRRSTASVQQL